MGGRTDGRVAFPRIFDKQPRVVVVRVTVFFSLSHMAFSFVGENKSKLNFMDKQKRRRRRRKKDNQYQH